MYFSPPTWVFPFFLYIYPFLFFFLFLPISLAATRKLLISGYIQFQLHVPRGTGCIRCRLYVVIWIYIHTHVWICTSQVYNSFSTGLDSLLSVFFVKFFWLFEKKKSYFLERFYTMKVSLFTPFIFSIYPTAFLLIIATCMSISRLLV